MVYYLTAAGSLTMQGPSGILIPLGIEQFVDLTTAYMFYNYIALGILFFIAAMSGAKNEARFCITIPILAGLFTFIGWLHAPLASQSWAICIITGILGVMIYMNETNHEKYGLGGPGSKFLNIILFIILFQVSIGFINGLNLMPIGQTQITPDTCVVGMTCDQYGNIQLSESMTTVQSSGGLFADILDYGTVLTSMIISVFRYIITLGAAILLAPILLSSTLEGLFPGISSNAAYLLFISALSVVFWAADALFIFNIYTKVFPTEGAV